MEVLDKDQFISYLKDAINLIDEAVTLGKELTEKNFNIQEALKQAAISAAEVCKYNGAFNRGIPILQNNIDEEDSQDA